MPRDYKSRASSSRKSKPQPVAAWVWFVAGVLVGVFVCGLAWLKFGAESAQTPRAAARVEQKRSKPAPEKKQQDEKAVSAKPRFDFYTILPEMEVVVPDPEPEPVASAGGQVQASGEPIAVTPSAEYMLQMGSFRKYSDADRLKASLALVGLEAEIQAFELSPGETVHRVRAGPYTRTQVNALRARLKQNNINSLVIRQKQ